MHRSFHWSHSSDISAWDVPSATWEREGVVVVSTSAFAPADRLLRSLSNGIGCRAIEGVAEQAVARNVVVALTRGRI